MKNANAKEDEGDGEIHTQEGGKDWKSGFRAQRMQSTLSLILIHSSSEEGITAGSEAMDGR